MQDVKVDIDYQKILKYEEKFLRNQAKEMIKIGNKVNKDLREESIMKWFRHFDANYKNTMHSIVCTAEMDMHTHSCFITFTSYIDRHLYDYKSQSMYQNSKYQNLDTFAYIVNSLQWNRGVMGLPRSSEFGYSDWVNENYMQWVSLEDFTEEYYKNRWYQRLKKITSV